MINERRVAEEPRRISDELISALIEEVKGFRSDMKPIREFMDQVNAAKLAAMWTVGIFASIGAIFASIGAALKWLKDMDIHRGP